MNKKLYSDSSMKKWKGLFVGLIAGGLLAQISLVNAQEMDKMWGNNGTVKIMSQESRQHRLFDWGNYAMFIHWGVYSSLGNKWNDKTYYGIGEWMMNENMAGIPVEQYKALAKDFNPTKFDAHAIARLAKDAGMKYIIITSKHHDGFAMFDSKACNFNIVKQTPFARDPMKELSAACKELGLGFGFYYSHNQDWTYPGGTGGPKIDANGNKKTFDDYFNEKCLPQVEEITRNYGDIELIWFDTPGDMPKKYAEKLVEVVHHNQPNALVSGRVGYDMGDYQTLGDMEIPLENVEGLWESVDVTNDSWGYAWYDQNWKTPKQIVMNLVSTVARGGTYMLNVGPDGHGVIPEDAQMALRSAGCWFAKYPQVVYGAGASPWKHALPWGDVTTNKGKLFLTVYEWPTNGKLYLPGWSGKVRSLQLFLANGKKKALEYIQKGKWLEIDVPMAAPEHFASVIELTLDESSSYGVETTPAVDPERGLTVSAKFADVSNAKLGKRNWMEKFGEWKTAFSVDEWNKATTVSWNIEIKDPGMYQIDLRYKGEPRLVWSVENDESFKIQNQQGASTIYTSFPIGWMKFEKAGKHRLTVRLLEGKCESASLIGMGLKFVEF